MTERDITTLQATVMQRVELPNEAWNVIVAIVLGIVVGTLFAVGMMR